MIFLDIDRAVVPSGAKHFKVTMVLAVIVTRTPVVLLHVVPVPGQLSDKTGESVGTEVIVHELPLLPLAPVTRPVTFQVTLA